MNLFSWLSSSPMVDRLGWTLLHSIWEGAAATVVLAALLAGARRASPRMRYAISSGTLALLVACLLFTFSIIPPAAPQRSNSISISTPKNPDIPVNRPASPLHAVSPEFGVAPGQPDVEPAALQPPISQTRTEPKVQVRPILRWFSLAWAAGVLLLTLWHIVSFIGVQRLRVAGTEPVEDSIAGIARQIAAQLGIGRSVPVLRSIYAHTPMLIGWLKPVILLPAAVTTGLSVQQIQAILAHELAHVRRHDYLVNLLQVIAETLLFYHPAAWWMSKRIRLERELCCDETAVEICGGDRCGYVESLAALEELRMEGAPLALAATGAGGAQLLQRARRLLGAGDNPARRGARVSLALAGLVCLLLLFIVIRLHAAPPADQPADAAALVREVRAAEAWIDTAKSLRLKVELVWKGTPNLEDAASDKVPPRYNSAFSLDLPETLVMGFDDHRLYFRADAQEYQLIDHRTWDGKIAVMHSKYSPREQSQEHYMLEKEPWTIGENFMNNLSWPRAGPHQYWWVRNRGFDDWIYGGKPEDFHLTGREKFRGTDCYVLESDVFYRTFYIGVADHRLYGLTNRVLVRFSGNSRASIGQEIAKAMGHEVKNSKELNAWLDGLSPAEKSRYQKESFKRLRAFTRPQTTHWYENYKEVAPGCWMPMHQGYDIWEENEDPTAEPTVKRTHDMKILETTVNQPLPDQWFVWEFTEGVQMADRRNDPMLLYKYKKHFEPAEWQAIVDEANQQKARRRPVGDNPEMQVEMQVRATQAVLGKPAPEFPPDAQWINSQPLKLADLQGKVMLIEFCASWSKFSLEDIAKLNELYEHGKDGVVIVSVHAAGTPVEDVRKWAKDNGIKYPICIDTPGDKGPWEGAMFNAYHVMSLPETYVMNRQGKVKSQGMLVGAVDIAQRATTQPAPAPKAR